MYGETTSLVLESEECKDNSSCSDESNALSPEEMKEKVNAALKSAEKPGVVIIHRSKEVPLLQKIGQGDAEFGDVKKGLKRLESANARIYLAVDTFGEEDYATLQQSLDLSGLDSVKILLTQGEDDSYERAKNGERGVQGVATFRKGKTSPELSSPVESDESVKGGGPNDISEQPPSPEDDTSNTVVDENPPPAESQPEVVSEEPDKTSVDNPTEPATQSAEDQEPPTSPTEDPATQAEEPAAQAEEPSPNDGEPPEKTGAAEEPAVEKTEESPLNDGEPPVEKTVTTDDSQSSGLELSEFNSQQQFGRNRDSSSSSVHSSKENRHTVKHSRTTSLSQMHHKTTKHRRHDSASLRKRRRVQQRGRRHMETRSMALLERKSRFKNMSKLEKRAKRIKRKKAFARRRAALMKARLQQSERMVIKCFCFLDSNSLFGIFRRIFYENTKEMANKSI